MQNIKIKRHEITWLAQCINEALELGALEINSRTGANEKDLVHMREKILAARDSGRFYIEIEEIN